MNSKIVKNIQKLNSKQGLLHEVVKRGYQPQRLHIYESGKRQSMSGIRATIFGATGFMGPYVGASLGYISSDVIFPHCHKYSYDDEVKELKLCAATGYSYIVRHMNFEDLRMIDRCIANSNVVINLCGPRKTIKHRKDYEYVNVTIPQRIAAACKKNPGVLRMIHFSGAGASPDSQSLDLQTKYYGEKAVMDEFPNATIFRPTTIYGPNDYFVKNIMQQREYFYHYNLAFSDLTAKRQPILYNDVALAVLNALKLDETAGNTYELGGPHVYTMKEVYEVIFNIIQREPKLVYVNRDAAIKFAQWFKNWEYFNLDNIIKEGLDIVVNQGAKTIKDLYIQPVSFPQGVEKHLTDMKARFPHKKDEMER